MSVVSLHIDSMIFVMLRNAIRMSRILTMQVGNLPEQLGLQADTIGKQQLNGEADECCNQRAAAEYGEAQLGSSTELKWTQSRSRGEILPDLYMCRPWNAHVGE